MATQATVCQLSGFPGAPRVVSHLPSTATGSAVNVATLSQLPPLNAPIRWVCEPAPNGQQGYRCKKETVPGYSYNGSYENDAICYDQSPPPPPPPGGGGAGLGGGGATSPLTNMTVTDQANLPDPPFGWAWSCQHVAATAFAVERWVCQLVRLTSGPGLDTPTPGQNPYNPGVTLGSPKPVIPYDPLSPTYAPIASTYTCWLVDMAQEGVPGDYHPASNSLAHRVTMQYNSEIRSFSGADAEEPKYLQGIATADRILWPDFVNDPGFGFAYIGQGAGGKAYCSGMRMSLEYTLKAAAFRSLGQDPVSELSGVRYLCAFRDPYRRVLFGTSEGLKVKDAESNDLVDVPLIGGKRAIRDIKRLRLPGSLKYFGVILGDGGFLAMAEITEGAWWEDVERINVPTTEPLVAIQRTGNTILALTAIGNTLLVIPDELSPRGFFLKFQRNYIGVVQ